MVVWNKEVQSKYKIKHNAQQLHYKNELVNAV
jgi:hypothetical protein